jgi:Zn-dependent peptidase ImmA (M78 family)
MPDDDFKVSPLSNLEVRSVAKKLRAFFGVENDERVDVLKCARSDKILTVKGVRPFRYEIISDHRMDGDHGKTNYDGDTIVVAVSRSTHHNAFMGMGHARNTIAHELGHATLHFEKLIHGAVMARRIGANVTPGWIKSYESAEHQTKVFAPAFLVNDEVARTLDSPDEISVRFGISQQSAEIYHAQILEERETSIKRTELAKSMKDFADQFGKSIAPKTQTLQFMNDPCSICGKQTVFPVGHKYICVSPAIPFMTASLMVTTQASPMDGPN